MAVLGVMVIITIKDQDSKNFINLRGKLLCLVTAAPDQTERNGKNDISHEHAPSHEQAALISLKQVIYRSVRLSEFGDSNISEKSQ